MKLCELLDIDALHGMIDRGLVSEIRHPEFPLAIYNYTQECQLRHEWNDITCKCRGIVVNTETGEIVARPFDKFFNYFEIEDKTSIPDDTHGFRVYEKVDGTLGVVYWWNGKAYISTRGSFNGPQAEHANGILNDRNHRHLLKVLSEYADRYTFMFEIVYPENMLCVRYDFDDLVLIGCRETATGEYADDMLDTIAARCPETKVAECYRGITDWLNVTSMFDPENKEGFVVAFDNGFRVKMKFQEYFRLQSLKGNLSRRHILDLVEQGNMDVLWESIEFLNEEQQFYYKSIIDNIVGTGKAIMETARSEYREDFSGDREMAEYFKGCTYPTVMFALYKGKDTSGIVNKLVRRKFAQEN